MSFLFPHQRNLAFKQQLNVAVTIGVICFALLSSLLTSWQGMRQIRATMVEQGERIAENLALQSVLALLYAAPENATEAVNIALLFPDVTHVEILQPNGTPLILRDKGDFRSSAVPVPDANIRRAQLEEETSNSWRFVAAVVSKGSDSPFELAEHKEELLGFVRVVQSKDTLTRMLAQIFLVNLLVSLLFAAMFLLVIRRLASRLTRPITELSEVMARAEQGESNVRAHVRGPKDIVDMAKAFNSMIAALQDRESALTESRARYREVVDSVKEVIFQTDAAGEWVLLNATWQEITGIEIRHALGRPVSDYVIEDDRELVEIWHARLKHGEAADCRFVVRFKRKDGSVGWLEVAQNSRRGNNGEFLGTSGTLDDITDRKRAEERIQFLAYHDVLTELPNRVLVQDRFHQAIAYADRSNSKVALLFLDLDHFKTINDSLGHLIGDELIKEAAKRITECVREMDTVSRQGGDEFLIVLPGLPDAEAIAPILVKLMSRMIDPCVIEGNELVSSASIGITIYPDDGKDFDSLLKKSDMAMYRAKESGRNAYRFFDDQMNVEAVEQLRMRSGLRKALTHGEFVLHYQPQMNIASGGLIGAEALIRWNHPELGMVPPSRFIPIAEDSGLIVPMGEWVLRESCRQAVSWQKTGMRDLTVAVNLSAVQFKRGDIEQSVIRALEESGLDPTLLELELTESILIHDTERILGTVQRLKLLGVKLSIDDFGTGYSSLSYLKCFQVDKIKIDQSFVRDLVSDTEDAAIVRAIIQMSNSLGLTTIAEGVENETVLERLRKFGCNEAQGYYFARPMPSDDFSTFRTQLLTGPERILQGGKA